MRLLLDTHILLWWLADDQRLPMAAVTAIGDPHAEIYVSAISFAEIAIKTSMGKLSVQGDLRAATRQSGYLSLPFTAEHAQRLTDLPWHHRDPFDRMLIAQALDQDLTFVSVDKACREYAARVLP